MLAKLGMLSSVVLLFLTACAPASPGGTSSVGAPQPQAQASKTLRVAVRVEPASLARNPPREGQTTLDTTRRLFNAELVVIDDTGASRPFLAEQLPVLHTDSWQVFPDGRMETTYRLKPGLTWHDGAPLTADDFAFGWRVLANPALGQASLIPQKLMEEVVAPDPRTVLIRWTQPFPDAGTLNITFSRYRRTCSRRASSSRAWTRSAATRSGAPRSSASARIA
jgi:ABC-type transport system substrate-binding protein